MKNITRTALLGAQRMNVSNALFGAAFPMIIEPKIYNLAAAMAASYNGAYWEMYTLSNGGFYMAPDKSKSWEIDCINQYTGTVSSDALGLIVCLYAYSHLSFRQSEYYAKSCAEHFHALRNYALDHKEAAAVFRAID